MHARGWIMNKCYNTKNVDTFSTHDGRVRFDHTVWSFFCFCFSKRSRHERGVCAAEKTATFAQTKFHQIVVVGLFSQLGAKRGLALLQNTVALLSILNLKLQKRFRLKKGPGVMS